MGIKGLTPFIKACPGVVEDLKTKTCHIDFPEMFFALLNARAFYATVSSEAKKSRKRCALERIPNAHSEGVISKRPGTSMQTTDFDSNGPPSKHARLSSPEADSNKACDDNTLRAAGSEELISTFKGSDVEAAPSSFLETMQRLLQEEPSQIFLDSDGALTTTQDLNEDIYYRHIGLAVHGILLNHVSPDCTTIHQDGPRSVEKENAHQKRDNDLHRRMEKLREDIEKGRLKGTKKLYRRLKSLYRAPLYEVCMSVTLPVGKEWTTFKKADLLEQLQLPTSAHLLLLAALTTNDYADGVPFYGLVSNADIVRKLQIERLESIGVEEKLLDFKNQLSHCLSEIHSNALRVRDAALENRKKRKQKVSASKADRKDEMRIDKAQRQLDVTINHFDIAIRVLVTTEEHPLTNTTADPSPSMPDICSTLTTLIRDSEMAKASRYRYIRAQAPDVEPSVSNAHQPMDVDLSPEAANLAPPPITLASPPIKRSGKRKKRNSTRAQSKRKQKWRQSVFRSRTDLTDRYVPQTAHLSAASPIDDANLHGLEPAAPRTYKPKEKTTNNNQPVPPPQKKRKKMLDYRKENASPAALKKSFKSVFASVTLTTGSVRGCLRRATDLSMADTELISQRIDMAVSIVNTAKHYVLKMLEMRILRELLSGSPQTTHSPAAVREMAQGTVMSDEQANQNAPATNRSAPFLEKILDSDWAELVVGNLMSYVLRNSTSVRGPKAHKPTSQDALVEARLIFEGFKELYPGFKAVNPSDIPLGVVIDDLAPKICLDIKMHYRKLPKTIRAKMEKLGFDDADLPQTEEDAEDDSNVDAAPPEGDEEDDEDPRQKSKKIVFRPRHILTCWSDLQKLPTPSQPQFCIQPKMTDSFIDIREEGLMRILWGRDAGSVGEIWEGGTHSHQWAKSQLSTAVGNIIKTLFIGDRESIRLAKKQQTTVRHNESILTQSSFSSSSSSSSVVTPSLQSSPPSLPAPRQSRTRYALNNFIRTDGHQLQLLGYDLTRNRQAPGHKSFMKRIENQCPTRQSLIDTFGENLESVVVIGIDPGEVVSGAFCMRLDEDTVVNLVVRRASLYQPTLAFRTWEENWKRQYPQAGPSDKIDTELWTRRADGQERPTSLPSLYDLQNALRPTSYDSWDSLVAAHQRYFELEPILHGFHSSPDRKKAAHQHRMAKLSEMDLAVAGVLRMVDEALEGIPVKERKVFFALGNGTFRTGLNLTSLHTTFLRRLFQKSTALGYHAALVDEYLSSTMCPTCTAKDEQTRLAKPSMRVCACIQCSRWIHRDLVGAHNIALIGEQYLKTMGRPQSLARPQVQSL
ncbi:hypothetical protein EMPS_10588 [Entomortierella parvispora]|uniref:Cas12f1-like TNB domain-containing protein n=1 Tax=Entomortierella parvispora TaxID=205924 RepID=A0A9P3HK33_9FUNG|nr:hypothetical protein EMPS_10588 [Entomortierella parvispora]